MHLYRVVTVEDDHEDVRYEYGEDLAEVVCLVLEKHKGIKVRANLCMELSTPDELMSSIQ